MTAILVAEDEPEIADIVATALRSEGYEISIAADGFRALEAALSGEFALLVLDVGLPGIDGFRVLRGIRDRDQSLPVIMLTARGSAADTVAGLDGGAMDYVAKPFRVDELLARVRAVLRAAERKELTSLARKGLVLDLRARVAYVDERKVELSAREFALAEELLRHPGVVLSRAELLYSVWGFEHDPGSNVLEVYVSYLREKLGAARIETVRGAGYRLA
ncbi:response regulator transcription factor [soil metagenome]